MEKIGGCERYYLKFHGHNADSQECEINLEVFTLYYKEFRKPLDKKRNEHRQHIEDGDIDGFTIAGKLTVTRFEQEYAEKAVFESVIQSCTVIQQRRFKLHYIQGYTLDEIARLEKCTNQAVSDSIESVKKKIKKFFL